MTIPLTSPLPYFLIMSLLALVAFVLVKTIPFCKSVATPDTARFASLDGLRGFLALGVFFHHAVFTYIYFTAGRWQLPYSPLYLLLGKGAVYIFFMITGFLFWTKALAAQGQINPRRLYLNRVRRLYPMYLLFLTAVLLVIFAAAHWQLLDPPLTLLTQLLRWLTFGLFKYPEINQSDLLFPHGGKDVTGAGVAWTLTYEWLFYLLLPLLANRPLSLIRPERFLLAILLLLAAYVFQTTFTQHQDPKELAHVANFMLGMSAAYLLRRFPSFPLAQRWLFSLIPAACFATLLLAFPLLDTPGSLAVRLLLFIPFLCFLYGNTFFGLLNTRWAHWLGAASYSIYLLHGLILFLAVSLINHFHPITSLTPQNYWLLMAPVAVTVVLVASLTYRYFEHPFIGPPVPKPRTPETLPHAKPRTEIPVP